VKTSKTKEFRTPFQCPNCAATPNQHGNGGSSAHCEYTHWRDGACPGFLCECDDSVDTGLDTHGETFSNPCLEARCFHCGWGGRIPETPKKMPAWTKAALKAGWTPPKGWKP
jgi:hypothetical protein